MQSIIDNLCKYFQEDHTNPRRFPGVADTLLTTVNEQTQSGGYEYHHRIEVLMVCWSAATGGFKI